MPQVGLEIQRNSSSSLSRAHSLGVISHPLEVVLAGLVEETNNSRQINLLVEIRLVLLDRVQALAKTTQHQLLVLGSKLKLPKALEVVVDFSAKTKHQVVVAYLARITKLLGSKLELPALHSDRLNKLNQEGSAAWGNHKLIVSTSLKTQDLGTNLASKTRLKERQSTDGMLFPHNSNFSLLEQCSTQRMFSKNKKMQKVVVSLLQISSSTISGQMISFNLHLVK